MPRMQVLWANTGPAAVLRQIRHYRYRSLGDNKVMLGSGYRVCRWSAAIDRVQAPQRSKFWPL